MRGKRWPFVTRISDNMGKDQDMKVCALDHVNIMAADIHATARFYADLLDLEIRNSPPPFTRDQAQWLCDREGRPIFHLNSIDFPRPFDRAVEPGPTGALHHIALSCVDYDEIMSRIDAMNLERDTNAIESIGLRQIFVFDPNGILLELNFATK